MAAVLVVWVVASLPDLPSSRRQLVELPGPTQRVVVVQLVPVEAQPPQAPLARRAIHSNADPVVAVVAWRPPQQVPPAVMAVWSVAVAVVAVQARQAHRAAMEAPVGVAKYASTRISERSQPRRIAVLLGSEKRRDT
jgi:hypothetical protein